MANLQKMPPWIQQTNICFVGQYSGTHLLAKNNDIIIPMGPRRSQTDSLIKYDYINDECVKLINFDDILPCRSKSICIDKVNDTLYAPCVSGIYKIDIKSKRTQHIFNEISDKYGWEW